MPQGGNSSYGMQRRLGAAKAHEFSLVSNYKLTYRNREDVTNLPAGVLIVGSQNVLSNVSERLEVRKGYVVDGNTSSVVAPILGSFDWETHNNAEAHLRAGFLISADGKVQYRYVDSSGVVTWRDLITGLSSTNFNFTQFWKTSESLRVALFCNGNGNMYEWNGATATILSSTSSTVTISGSTSWLNAGFYASTSPRAIVVGGTPYAYTGGESTLTLTGVTPDASALVAGSVVHQQYIVTATSTFTGPPAGLNPNLISVLNNQIYLGSTTNSAIWLSKVNSYTDYSHSSTRQPSEGGSGIVDANIVGFIVQGVETAATMYVSAGKDLWYKSVFTAYQDALSVPGETFGMIPIKNGKQQGAISQAFMSNMKNYVITGTNETTIDLMGVLENYLTQTQVDNISDPIKLDIDSYDFTDGSIFYFKYNIYVAVPKEGIVRVYSIATKSWEAPQTLPVSRFYIVDGELYGHGYNTSESYKLFTGYADRAYSGFLGYPIDAKMVFSYENYGTRATKKKATAMYVEGYVSANTTITCGITYELDGCATEKTFAINGSDTQIVCIPSSQSSLGKQSLGKQKLGGDTQQSIQGLPPKFRVQKTFSNTDFFECSVSFEILGVNNQFQILAFGLNASSSSSEAISIRQ